MAKQKEASDPAERSAQAVAAGLKAIATASRQRGIHTRYGLTGLDQQQIVQLLLSGTSWEDVKRKFSDVDDATMEGWKPELFRRTAHPDGERRMPHGTAPAAEDAQ
jgi:hypothetical protein